MAQLTSVRLRVRADDSIDRRCSTDTAYPFQPHRGQADPRMPGGRRRRRRRKRRGRALDATRAAAAEGCRGKEERSRGDCGAPALYRRKQQQPQKQQRRCRDGAAAVAALSAALTLRSRQLSPMIRGRRPGDAARRPGSGGDSPYPSSGGSALPRFALSLSLSLFRLRSRILSPGT